MRPDIKIATTAGELINILSVMDPDAGLITTGAPYDGIALVPQSDGGVLICSVPSVTGPREPSMMVGGPLRSA